MVLIEHAVPAIQDIVVNNVKVLQYAPPLSMRREQVLQDGNQNTMVGLLTQMSLLANYANDIFANIMSITSDTTNRILKISNSVTQMNDSIVKIEQELSTTPLQTLLSNPRQEFAIPPIAEQQLFTTENVPKAIKELYKRGTQPPPLHMMDPYMDDGKKCLQLYTNPHYFLDEWIAEQLKLRAAAKEERRKRREERRKRREGEGKKDKNLGPKKPTQIQKVIYDPHTGQKIIINQPVGEGSSAKPIAPSTLATSGQNNSSTSFFVAPPSGSASPAPPAHYDLPPPPPTSNLGFSSPPPLPRDDFPPPPPVHDDFPAPLPPPSVPSNGPTYHAPPPPGPSAVAPPPPPSFDAPPPPPANFAPPPPPADAPPPPPGMPVFEQSDAPAAPASGLMAALSQKAGGLRSVQTQAPPPKKVDAHSDLLNQIRSGKALTKVTAVQAEKPKAASGSSTVAEILARRIAIAPSDSDDSESDEDDDDWD